MTGADVLLMAGEPYDSEVARLVIYEVPGSRDLSWEQNRGSACVWCLVPGDQAALAPLGGAHGWRPHGCAACTQVRIKFLRAFVAWKDHVQGCEPCRGTWCPDGWALALAHNAAYELTGKRELLHCACGCAFPLASLRFRPYAEDNLTGLRYSHTGLCRASEEPAPAGEEPKR